MRAGTLTHDGAGYRSARAHRPRARGEDTDRSLFLAIGFVLATSGLVTVAYLIAPVRLTGIIVGSQYPLAATLIGPFAVAALLNALLSLWIAHFIGRGEMRFGIVLALAVACGVAAILVLARDAETYAWERGRR